MRYFGSRLVIAHFLATAAITLIFAASLHGQATSNPGHLVGTIRLTNTAADVLDVLTPPPGADEGFSSGSVSALSVGVSPQLNNSTSFVTSDRLSTPYEVTVEAGSIGNGIVYDLSVAMNLDFGGDVYFFSPKTSAPVESESQGGGDVQVDFEECAGLLDVRWQTTSGIPVIIDGGTIEAFREISPGSGGFHFQAADFALPAGVSQEHLAVRGDGSRYRVDIFYDTGTDTFLDRVRLFHRTFATVGCDQIVEIVIEVPEGGQDGGLLGQIVGEVDMLGEDEHSLSNLTLMVADSGPFFNFRLATVPGPTPSQGAFLLPNVATSDLTSPANGYRVYGNLSFRLGRGYEYFATPFLGGSNGEVFVPAGQTVDLEDTFEMAPGFVAGEVFLAGPPHDGLGSCLADLYRDLDTNGDGIPNNPFLNDSSVVRAAGSPSLASGATKSAAGGRARVLIDGAFDSDPTVNAFDGSYELVLGGLLQENSLWGVATELRFVDVATPNVPESFQSSVIAINDHDVPTLEIVPGQTIDVPVRRCFGQLNLGFVSTASSFFNPGISGAGNFLGFDFEGNLADYSVSVSASGTPRNTATAAPVGLIVACLPEGTYDFTPFVTSVNPGGGTSSTELPPVSGLEIGCMQIKDVTLGLQVNLDSPPACVSQSPLPLEGSATSTGSEPVAVDEIFASVDGGAVVPVCTNCGEDPTFSVDIPLAECDNQVTITAEDEFGNLSSTSVTTRLDGTAPALAGCEDLEIQIGAEESGALVDYPVTAIDQCDGSRPVSCNPPSGSFLPLGASMVTCTSTDTCGNQTSCSFGVEVRNAAPDPFPCIAGQAIVAQGADSQLSAVEMPASTTFLLDPAGTPAGIEYNNLGFRSTDGLLYAVELGPSGNEQIVRIDRDGEIFGLGRPDGLPAAPRFDAGDVTPDGDIFYVTTYQEDLYRIDLSTLPAPLPPAASTTVFGDDGRVFDWAYRPADGSLYGCDSDDGQLAVLDPVSGQRTDFAVADVTGALLPSGTAFGAAWLAGGRLVCYRNSGEIYEIDLSGPTIIGVRTGPASDRNDGAICPRSPLGSALEMISVGDGLPRTVSLEYVFENKDPVETLSALTAAADLRETFGVHGTDWVFHSASSSPPAFVNPSFDGFSDLELILANSSLPAGDVASVTVEVQLLTLDHVDAQGELCVQATVAGQTADGRSFADLSVPGLDPDPDGDGFAAENAPTCAGLGQLPFQCTGEPFMVRNSDAEVVRIDETGPAFTFSAIGTATGRELNNLGFRASDGLLYAVELDPRGNEQIVRIDATGTVFELGRPPGLPPRIRFDAGDVSTDGGTMYLTATNKRLYSVPLPTLAPVTSVTVTGDRGLVFDWAYRPADGRLYGGDMTHGQIAVLDPSGARNDLAISGLPTGRPYGGAWFGPSGRLFLYRNSGEIYEIDLAGPTVVGAQSGPASNRNDAASCVAP